jgi:carbon-monoxide dehydrogenase medium subunit
LRLAAPEVLVDLNRVPELAGIRAWDGGLAIGATTRQADLERSELAQTRLPLLVEATRLIGHTAIRHRGTIGGSLAHADPAAELPAVALAMDAEMTAVGPRGERRIPAADFFQGPFTTALESDEILTEVRLPQFAGGHAFVEFARTHGNFAVVGVAALVAVTEGTVTRVAVAASGVGPTPLRLTAAEQALNGAVPDGAAIGAAVDAGTAGLQPAADLQGSAATRIDIARAVLRDAIERAAERAQDRR